MPIIPDISKKLKEALKLEANFKEILNSNFPFYKSAKHSENSFDRIILYESIKYFLG